MCKRLDLVGQRELHPPGGAVGQGQKHDRAGEVFLVPVPLYLPPNQPNAEASAMIVGSISQ
ncbi:MAG: hypothetical protein JNK87_29390 [Bryobacterales bacterium]|nr:hypothetical protein [Bryobacterales bacterium]